MSKLSHREIIAQCKQIIPPLSASLHKGQAGRVGVLGGSKDYAGAPYFAGMATLRLGSDLAHIISDSTAGSVIKSYSPDLIVHTDLSDNSTTETTTKALQSILPRLHTLVIGPGLGRAKYMLDAARIAIRIAKDSRMYIVIDADGLFLIQDEPEMIQGYKRAILTPNVVEFARLCKALDVDNSPDANPNETAANLARALGGLTILQKGSVDRITNGSETLINSVEGSNRRCGGQGDVLSGSIGCFLAWGKWYEENSEIRDKIPVERITLLAAYGASTTTRTASKLTFQKKKRSMQTTDLLDEVGTAFEATFGDDAVNLGKL